MSKVSNVLSAFIPRLVRRRDARHHEIWLREIMFQSVAQTVPRWLVAAHFTRAQVVVCGTQNGVVVSLRAVVTVSVI